MAELLLKYNLISFEELFNKQAGHDVLEACHSVLGCIFIILRCSGKDTTVYEPCR